MRRLIITENMTLDRSVEMLDDWFDPQLQDEDLLAESHRQDAEADALLLGRRTFEDFRSYWPHQDEDPTGITAYLNQVQKFVVSSTITDPGWANSAVLTGDWLDSVRRLKQRTRPPPVSRPECRPALAGAPPAFRSGIVLLRSQA